MVLKARVVYLQVMLQLSQCYILNSTCLGCTSDSQRETLSFLRTFFITTTAYKHKNDAGLASYLFSWAESPFSTRLSLMGVKKLVTFITSVNASEK